MPTVHPEECWRVPMLGSPPERSYVVPNDTPQARGSHVWGPIVSAPDAAIAVEKALHLFPFAAVVGEVTLVHPSGNRHMRSG